MPLNLKCLCVTAAVIAASACSEQQVYDAVQTNLALECQKYPDTRYDDCMAQVGGSYEDYTDSVEEVESGASAGGKQP